MVSVKKFRTIGLILASAALATLGLSTLSVNAQAPSPSPIVIVITATPSMTPVPGATATSAPACPNYVVVKPGDDLFRISLSANTSWPVVAALNNIPNPNIIYVGQTICLPGPVGTPAAAVTTLTPTVSAVAPDLTPTTTPIATGTATIVVSGTPATTIALLPTNTAAASPVVAVATTIYPTIALNTYLAGSGDTVVITGVNFAASSTLDIFLAPFSATNTGVPTGTPVATTTAGADGSLSVNFTIPASPSGTPLTGKYWTVTVQSRANKYYGFTSYTNNK